MFPCFLSPLLLSSKTLYMWSMQASVPMLCVHQLAHHLWAVRSLFIRQNDLHVIGRLLQQARKCFTSHFIVHLLILFITTLSPSTMSANGHSRLHTSLPVYLLTYGAEPFLRSCQLCSHWRTSQHFMEPEGSLTCTQEPSTGPYPEPDQSSPYHPILRVLSLLMEGLTIRRVAANILNKQSLTADRGWSSSLEGWAWG
jgi:hypothetical protein